MSASPRPASDRRIVAIVLAAGASVRMGTQKLLLPVQGRPMLAMAVEAALASCATEVVVVTGHGSEAVQQVLEGLPVTLKFNSDHAAGLSTSIRAGLDAAGDCDAAMFLLGDQPFVTAALLDLLVDEHRRTGKGVVRPVVGGRPANPVLIAAALFPELRRQEGDVGGREVAARHPEQVHLVQCDDPRQVMDIDSRQDYDCARELP